MRPPRHAKCSDFQIGLVGHDGLTGQGVFAYTNTRQDAYAVGVFAGVVGRTREKYGRSHSAGTALYT